MENNENSTLSSANFTHSNDEQQNQIKYTRRAYECVRQLANKGKSTAFVLLFSCSLILFVFFLDAGFYI